MIAWLLDSVLAFWHGLLYMPELSAAAVRVVSVEPERASSSESVTVTMRQPIPHSAARRMAPPTPPRIVHPHREIIDVELRTVDHDQFVADCLRQCMASFGEE